VPIGYLVAVALVGWCTLFALAPLRRPWALARMSWGFGFLVNELPFVAFYWLLASTWLALGQADLDTRVAPSCEMGLAQLRCVRARTSAHGGDPPG
jgi:uncharacterized membrane protein